MFEMEFTETKLRRSLWLRARWAQNYFESPEMQTGKLLTLIASFLPWKYYCVSTIQLNTFDPLAKLTTSLEKNMSYKDVTEEVIGYVTQIFRCDKMGWVKSFDNPLFEQEYSELSKAIKGHTEAVKKFSKGGAVYSPSGSRIE